MAVTAGASSGWYKSLCGGGNDSSPQLQCAANAVAASAAGSATPSGALAKYMRTHCAEARGSERVSKRKQEQGKRSREGVAGIVARVSPKCRSADREGGGQAVTHLMLDDHAIGFGVVDVEQTDEGGVVLIVELHHHRVK